MDKLIPYKGYDIQVYKYRLFNNKNIFSVNVLKGGKIKLQVKGPVGSYEKSLKHGKYMVDGLIKKSSDNFEGGFVGKYKVTYMNHEDESTLSEEMFDSLDEAKKKAKELSDNKFTVVIFELKLNNNGKYSWITLPFYNYADKKYYKYVLLTVCVITIILALKLMNK